MKKIFLLPILALMLLNCSEDKDTLLEEPTVVIEEPVEEKLIADFKFSSDIVNETDDLSITNLSVGATEYSWDFSVNQKAIDVEVPNFNYSIHGLYDVTLTVKNEEGLEDSVTKTIEVLCNFLGGNTKGLH